MLKTLLYTVAMVVCFNAVAESKKDDELSPGVLALQGVWAPEGGPSEDDIQARLVVHGSYSLLIYQNPGHKMHIFEVKNFQADGTYITDAKGERVIEYYCSTSPPSVSFEISDESPHPVSRKTEFAMSRVGRLPNLNLTRPKKR